ncbi:MAG: M1 family metallopeptidase [Bacteroidota bacterium]
MKYFFKAIGIFSFLLACNISSAQYTHQDTLRGSITRERAWWDVLKYDISVQPDYTSKTITGITKIQFKVLKAGNLMQVDLQEPMVIDSIRMVNFDNRNGKTIASWKRITDFKREGNVYHIKTSTYKPQTVNTIQVYYHGKPREAVNPPWDGGWIWKKDDEGRPWMSVACEITGASLWYPCKDHQSDEPDSGALLTITVPDSLTAVGNGRLKEKRSNGNGTNSWTWEVKNPINNYNIIPYIGKYVTWHDEYMGEKGKLDLDYWVLDYDLEKAKKQFGRDVKPMLKCFEEWFGPYPFYEDSYKLVQSPHLGMEHQSAVAYGNKFMDGYLGRDLSGSGWGLKWDYIIVHESGHEWFGNNITTNDPADMWVHEGFTDYAEPLFVECQYGKKAGDEYCQGLRRNITNDKPVIGPYNVNTEGSGDMYAKGANLLHTIRQVINNDTRFKGILRGLNKTFYHKTVTSKQVENYISKQAGKDLSKIFDQYLHTIHIPVLEYRISGSSFSYRWADCISGFNMPVKISSGGTEKWINPAAKWQKQVMADWFSEAGFAVDKNFYIRVKKIE